MGKEIVFRPMEPADGPALSDLYQVSPDTGRIQIAPLYHLDAYAAFTEIRPNAVGVVAEAADINGLIGAGFVDFGQCYFENEVRDYASLSGVVVHPDYRRQGIATKLAQWRVEFARQRLGDGAVILTSIQEQNTGSFVIAKKWSHQFVGQVTAGAIAMRKKAPTKIAGINVRLSGLSELDAVVTGFNTFYRDYNLFEPQTAGSFQKWLEQTPFETPFHHYYIALGDSGDILAGLAISEEYRAIEMQVKKLPIAIRLLNKLVDFVPPDGALKQLGVSKIWFAPGQLKAAQYLWEMIRWEWRERANTATVFYDSRSPIADIFNFPFWMPASSFTLAVQGPVLMQEEKLIYPL